MNPTFNLVDEPWIPCVKPGGEVEHVGLLRALAGAHEYLELRDPSPLVTVTLHRLLLAILHRVFGPEGPDVWAGIWQGGAGRFDGERLVAYLKDPGWYSRFDLFDREHPFYQTASIPLGPADKKNDGRPKFVKPIWQLAHELAYSDSMQLFAHYKHGDWETRPASEAARWLVAIQSFALAGLITTEEGKKAQDGSADAGQLVKSAVVLAQGDNLFQSLMLNFVHYSGEDECPFRFKPGIDLPAWERDGDTRPDDRRYDGYLDLLTWQSRRVKLVPELDPTGRLLGVSGVVCMKGFQLPDDYWRSRFETMVGFLQAKDAKGKQDPWPPLGIRVGRDLWRDCHALLQTVAEECQRPRTIQWLDDLRLGGHLKRAQIQLSVAGMSVDRAKIFLWRHESLPLPLAYLDRADLVDHLKRAIRLAEDAADALRVAARASFAPDRLYWSRLEPPFRELVVALAAKGASLDGCVADWFVNTLRRVAEAAFEETIGRIDGGRDLKAVNAGRGVLYGRLKKIARENRFPELKKEGAA